MFPGVSSPPGNINGVPPSVRAPASWQHVRAPRRGRRRRRHSAAAVPVGCAAPLVHDAEPRSTDRDPRGLDLAASGRSARSPVVLPTGAHGLEAMWGDRARRGRPIPASLASRSASTRCWSRISPSRAPGRPSPTRPSRRCLGCSITAPSAITGSARTRATISQAMSAPASSTPPCCRSISVTSSWRAGSPAVQESCRECRIVARPLPPAGREVGSGRLGRKPRTVMAGPHLVSIYDHGLAGPSCPVS